MSDDLAALLRRAMEAASAEVPPGMVVSVELSMVGGVRRDGSGAIADFLLPEPEEINIRVTATSEPAAPPADGE